MSTFHSTPSDIRSLVGLCGSRRLRWRQLFFQLSIRHRSAARDTHRTTTDDDDARPTASHHAGATTGNEPTSNRLDFRADGVAGSTGRKCRNERGIHSLPEWCHRRRHSSHHRQLAAFGQQRHQHDRILIQACNCRHHVEHAHAQRRSERIRCQLQPDDHGYVRERCANSHIDAPRDSRRRIARRLHTAHGCKPSGRSQHHSAHSRAGDSSESQPTVVGGLCGTQNLHAERDNQGPVPGP